MREAVKTIAIRDYTVRLLRLLDVLDDEVKRSLIMQVFTALALCSSHLGSFTRLKVKAATASVFATIFSKAEARGSVPWADFAAAMADLNFSVTPKGGPIFTFNPLESMDSRPITLHRPHASEIEGFQLLFFAQRLNRVYRWDAETFEVI